MIFDYQSASSPKWTFYWTTLTFVDVDLTSNCKLLNDVTVHHLKIAR